ncbi:MAG: bifunctional glutamate N-acetyltransferase/amino-acid acetyltransferase ArgJ, partial [Lachnospiraceae bacterium]|nr:bifunctional glutamate N-acetyltransferase/amino-acid acetyltransferase ArgJ [Lachnospiraceae bacterium]
EGGVTAAKGYMAASAAAGIKYQGRTDMALVYSKTPAVCAGTFTTNVVKAAPVHWDKEIVEKGNSVHAVVLNAGIANACTGQEGKEINYYMASEIAGQLGIKPEEVLTASTGVIGVQIKKEPVSKGAALLKEALSDTKEAGTKAAKAIMTTDTVSKEAAACFEVDGVMVTVGGMSKGSGMIHPNMATMLSVTTTDASIKAEDLQELVMEVVSDTFNMISIDRDTSTNDTYLVLANGESGVEIKKGTKAYEDFKEALLYVSEELAKQMAGDGEGCTKLFEVQVLHCRSKENAKILSKSVITSNLVKTAVYGSDANWGRILCALGYAGVDFDPEVIDLILEAKGENLILVKDGVATDYSEEKATELLSEKKVTVLCDMKEGAESATAWGCDLTYDYVKINGDYRS